MALNAILSLLSMLGPWMVGNVGEKVYSEGGKKDMADWINRKQFRVRNKYPYWEVVDPGGTEVGDFRSKGESEDFGLWGWVRGSTPREALRKRFLELAHGMCPEMWERFDSGPLQCSSNKPELFEVKLREWLQHFGLYDSWQDDWIRSHLDRCLQRGIGSEGGWFFPESMGSGIGLVLPPGLEGREARQKVRESVDRMLDQVFGRLQVGDSHLKWFIRYQVMGHSSKVIALDEGRHPSVINKGIAEMADRLAIETLRKRRREGRELHHNAIRAP